MSLVWINGQLVDKSEAKISVFDHGFLYGDGAWAHMRAFNGKLFRPERAIGSLYVALHSLGIELSLRADEVQSAIESTLRANGRREEYIRVVVTRGAGTLGPDPRKLDPQLIIVTEEYQPFPVELYEHGLHATIATYALAPQHLFFPNHLAPLMLVEAKKAAITAGCFEAVIFCRDQAYRCIEGSLFVVRGGMLHQFGAALDVVAEAVLELAEQLSIPFESDVGAFLANGRFDDLVGSDEVFLAGISCGVIGIVQVDGKPLGSGTEGPITRRIREAYRKLTRGEL